MAKDDDNSALGLPIEALQWLAEKRSKPTSPEDIEARTMEYLQLCETWGTPPSKPGLALAWGLCDKDQLTTWPMMQGWAEEESERWSQAKKKSIAWLEASHMARTATGARVADIFLSKAVWGYSDQGQGPAALPTTINIQLIQPPNQETVSVPDVQATLIR